MAFVQCAGSRDENHLKHCSGVCCLASLKHARYVREQYPDAQIYVFYIDIRRLVGWRISMPRCRRTRSSG